MKETVRRYFWWPGITRDIEALVQKCEACKKYRKKPPPQPLCPWPFSKRPMERVHIDFCEYRGKMILVMVDSFSKKIWTSMMGADTTSRKTVALLSRAKQRDPIKMTKIFLTIGYLITTNFI